MLDSMHQGLNTAMALDEVPEKYRTAVEEFMKTDEYLMM